MPRAPIETVFMLLWSDGHRIESEQEILSCTRLHSTANAMPGVDKRIGAGYPHAMIPASLPEAEPARISVPERRFGLRKWAGAPRRQARR